MHAVRLRILVHNIYQIYGIGFHAKQQLEHWFRMINITLSNKSGDDGSHVEYCCSPFLQ